MISAILGVATVAAVVFYMVVRKKLGKQSVDSIVSDITEKVEQLHAVKDAKHLEAEVHNAAVVEKQKLAALALTERDRAKAIAEKLTSLVS